MTEESRNYASSREVKPRQASSTPENVRVITYGTFDLLHYGHRLILSRSKALGTHLTVGVTTDSFDKSRGKLNVQQSLSQRIQNVQLTGLADAIIVEENDKQKPADILKYNIDIFTIGSDWAGKFDHLSAFCRIVYLPRTEGVSSTILRRLSGADPIRLGIVGFGRIAARFLHEARSVPSISVTTIWSRNVETAGALAREHHGIQEMETAGDFGKLLEAVDALYIATPHGSHVEYAARAIQMHKHVLCEKPLALSGKDARCLYAAAAERGVVLLEAIKTAFAPCFLSMLDVVRSGYIGAVRSVDARFTKLIDGSAGGRREYEGPDGGSISETGSYPMLAVVKVLGTAYTSIATASCWTSSSGSETQVEVFSRISITYPHAIASATTGLGVKSEGDLVISGTKGYIYCPAPWWKMTSFECRFEDTTRNRLYEGEFEGDGLRHEIAEFAKLIRERKCVSKKLTEEESICIVEMLESARSNPTRFG